jgi:hypothetical protein
MLDGGPGRQVMQIEKYARLAGEPADQINGHALILSLISMNLLSVISVRTVAKH